MQLRVDSNKRDKALESDKIIDAMDSNNLHVDIFNDFDHSGNKTRLK